MFDACVRLGVLAVTLGEDGTIGRRCAASSNECSNLFQASELAVKESVYSVMRVVASVPHVRLQWSWYVFRMV